MSDRPTSTDKKEGSLIIDGAITLPFFTVAIALLLMLIAQAGREETVTNALVKSSIAAVDAAAALDKGDDFFIAGNLSLRTFLEAQLVKDWGFGSGITGIPRMYTGIDGFPVSFKAKADDVAVVRVNVASALPAIGAMTDRVEGCRTVVFKPFTGESERSFKSDDRRVYVFPKYGERYHTEGCYILQDGIVETILTRDLKKRCRACRLCSPPSNIGAKIYKYLETSGVYHRKDCPSVSKSYVSMTRGHAIEQGYSACMLCKGGD